MRFKGINHHRREMSLTVGQQSHELQILVRLLIGSGLVTREEFEAARQLCIDGNMPITQAVTMSGLLSEKNLELSMQVQSRVVNNEITSDLGIRALRMALQQKLSLDEAIYSVQSMHEKTVVVVSAANELTSLLLSARFISAEDLGRLIMISKDSSMMIGHLLVLDGKITSDELLGALNLVLMCREYRLEKEKAAQGLRFARQRKVSVEQGLVDLGFFIHPSGKSVRLGELFLMARLITREDLCECLEIELFKQKRFGQIVLERGIVTQYQLESAVKLLSFVGEEVLQPWQAAEALWKVCSQKDELEFAMQSFQMALQTGEYHRVMRLSDLLVHADVCTRREMQRALHNVPEDALQEAEALITLNMVDKTGIQTALRLYTLLRLGYLPRDRVLELLRMCHDKGLTLDQALSRLGIYVPARFQWTWI